MLILFLCQKIKGTIPITKLQIEPETKRAQEQKRAKCKARASSAQKTVFIVMKFLRK